MFKVTIDPRDYKSIDAAIDTVEKYQKWLNSKMELLKEKLAIEGINYMSFGFQDVKYDGVNDVAVNKDFEKRGDGSYIISASGQSILFIEFGTGVRQPDGDYAAQHGYIRGEYGQKKGQNEKWSFYSHGNDQLSAGGYHPTDKKTGQVKDNITITYGNPANRVMYNTVKTLSERVADIASEVFNND